MSHLKSRREIQCRDLLLNGIDDALAAVAGVAAPKTTGAVQNATAVGAFVIHAFCAGQQARALLELTVGGERHPKRIPVFRLLGGLSMIMLGIGGFIVHGQGMVMAV